MAANYGKAGAIELYGPALRLPGVLSPHLAFWYCKPDGVAVRSVITIGFDEVGVRQLCGDLTLVSTIQAVNGVRNEEVGRPILLCSNPRVSLDDAWAQLRNFS